MRQNHKRGKLLVVDYGAPRTSLASGADRPVHLAGGFMALEGFTFVVILFAARKAQFDFGAAVLKIHAERD
jgi:hypothetical protein